MKRFCVALLFLGCWATAQAQAPLVPAAGGMINPNNGEFYPRVGPGGYVNPRTGQFLPSYEEPHVPGAPNPAIPFQRDDDRPRHREPSQQPAPVFEIRQQPMPPTPQQTAMVTWCREVYAIAVTVGQVRTTTPTTDPLYDALTQKWQNYSDTWRAKCQ